MNFSFLMIVVILILFFLIKQLRDDHKHYTIILVSSLTVILVVYEIYMTLGYKRLETFNSVVTKTFSQKMLELHDRIPKLDITQLIGGNGTTTQPPFNMGSGGIIHTQRLYNMEYQNETLWIFNNNMMSNSRLISVFDIPSVSNDITSKTPIEIDNEYKKYALHKLENFNNRYYSTSCSNDKLIMIAGGCNVFYDNLIVSNTVSVYMKEWKVWHKHTLSKPRYKMNSIAHNNKFYFIGGLKYNNEISSTIDIFDYSGKPEFKDVNAWTTIKMPFKGRIHFNVEAHAEKLYLIGGYDGDNYVERIDIYNIQTQKWSVINLPNNIFNLTKLNTNIISFDRENLEDQLYIVSSSSISMNYTHPNLVNVNNIDIPHSLHGNEQSVKTIKMGNWINELYAVPEERDIFEEETHACGELSLSFWIKIPEENRGQTKIVMGDYNLCSGETGSSEYNGIILHKDRLLPCFFLNKRLLIKNAEVPEIEYGKWIHVVYNIDYLTCNSDETLLEGVDTTTTQSGCLLNTIPESSSNIADITTTLAPVDDTGPNKILESHGNVIHINGSKNEYKMSFNIEYGEGLSLTGYEIYEGKLGFPKNAILSNIHRFTKNINYPTINDIYHTEYSLYRQPSIEFKVYNMELKSHQFKSIDIGITPDDYKNVITQTYKNRYLILALNTKTTDIQTKYVSYDTKTTNLDLLDTIDNNFIATNSIETENGVIMAGYKGNKYELSFINIKDVDNNNIDDLLSCIPGEKLIKNKCEQCPVDTYSDEINSKTCYACSPNTTTNNKTGQSQCATSPEFTHKTVFHDLDTQTKKIIKNNDNIYQDMLVIQNQDAENIKAYNNNLNLAMKKI